MTALLSVHELSAGYRRGQAAISEVSFTATAGAAIGVLGPNGGGKTTLFRALLGSLPVIEGSVSVEGSVAYVPQGERSALDFPVRALDVAVMGTYPRIPWYRRTGRAERAAGMAALERVGLAAEAGAAYGSLSGGQRQRVLIARALAQEAQVLLLDEPFTGVDRLSGERILGVLDELRREGRAVLMATHDVNQARWFHDVLCLNGRQIAFGLPAEVLTPAVLKATYGDELIVLDGEGAAVAIQHHAH